MYFGHRTFSRQQKWLLAAAAEKYFHKRLKKITDISFQPRWLKVIFVGGWHSMLTFYIQPQRPKIALALLSPLPKRLSLLHTILA